MNVEDLLQAKNIEYIPKGGDFVIRCINPDHEDRNPSLRIDRITGIYNCFSCNAKGNIFTHFKEKPNELQVRRESLKKKIRLKASESVGLSIPVDAHPYEGSWRGINPETYRRFEAFESLQQDFRGRLVFPIRNISGHIVAFNGRHMSDGVPKYLISPPHAKIPLFPQATPYRGSIILVEGIFDMLNLHDKGLTNTVCSHGTRNVNKLKLSLLKIQGVGKLYIFFDGDTAGQEAASSVKDLCEEVGIISTNIHIKHKDPGELSLPQIIKLKEQIYD